MQVAEELVKELKTQNKKIALAESCTGGLIAKLLTDVSGASNVFECGIVSYSCDIKHKLLNVDKDLLSQSGPVNEETARQMAKGVLALSNADLALSVTGVAGPGPDGPHPEGEIYIALVAKDKEEVKKLETNTKGERDYNRRFAAEQALTLALDYLKEV